MYKQAKLAALLLIYTIFLKALSFYEFVFNVVTPCVLIAGTIELSSNVRLSMFTSGREG